MIGYINGKIIAKEGKAIIVQADAVGYLVFIPATIFAETNIGQNISLFIKTIVREDDISLYGFVTNEDKKFFELLLSVKGVGPKTALDILTQPKNNVIMAIVRAQPELLTRIKGIGKKTAERIILELKNKMITWKTEDLSPLSQVEEELVSALENLGYEKHLIYRVLEKKPKEVSGTEEEIKWFLRNV